MSGQHHIRAAHNIGVAPCIRCQLLPLAVVSSVRQQFGTACCTHGDCCVMRKSKISASVQVSIYSSPHSATVLLGRTKVIVSHPWHCSAANQQRFLRQLPVAVSSPDMDHLRSATTRVQAIVRVCNMLLIAQGNSPGSEGVLRMVCHHSMAVCSESDALNHHCSASHPSVSWPAFRLAHISQKAAHLRERQHGDGGAHERSDSCPGCAACARGAL